MISSFSFKEPSFKANLQGPTFTFRYTCVYKGVISVEAVQRDPTV